MYELVGRRMGAWMFALALSALSCASLSAAETAVADKTITVVGDSLSAAYGLRAEQGWVALLEKKLKARSTTFSVVNASISGDTTRGGRSRLGRLLKTLSSGDVVVVELGGNDGLRGVVLAETRRNLESMLTQIDAAGVQTLLVGMQLPPNLGPQYTAAFAAIYPQLAKAHGTALVPFLLEGIAVKPELMQGDGIHPKAVAQSLMLDNVWPHLVPLL